VRYICTIMQYPSPLCMVHRVRYRSAVAAGHLCLRQVNSEANTDAAFCAYIDIFDHSFIPLNYPLHLIRSFPEAVYQQIVDTITYNSPTGVLNQASPGLVRSFLIIQLLLTLPSFLPSLIANIGLTLSHLSALRFTKRSLLDTS
jgi:hypothetical protein